MASTAVAAPGDLDPAFGTGVFTSSQATDSGEVALDQDALGRPVVA